MDHSRSAADHKRLAALEKIGRDLGEGRRALGGDRMPSVIDEDEMAIREQLLVETTDFGRDHAVQGAEQHQGRNSEAAHPLFECWIAAGPDQPLDEPAVLACTAGSTAGSGGMRSGWA